MWGHGRACALLLVFLAGTAYAQSEEITFLFGRTFTVLEAQPAGTQVANLMAYYVFGGSAFTDGTFSLSSANGDHLNFTISDGTLLTTAEFDRDGENAKTEYAFTLTYSTPLGTSRSQDTSVRIGDINDNPPTFAARVFNVSVFESTDPGVSFAAVSASDPDSVQTQQLVDYAAEALGPLEYIVANGRVVYDLIERGGVEGVFSLDPDTGAVSIAAGRVLNYDAINLYNYSLRARDGDNQTDTAELIVHVLDSNNHHPVIHGPFNVSVVIPEDTPLGFVVVEAINATDGDHGSNEEISFRISSGNPRQFFSIDSESGRITTGQLDRDVSDSFTLVVTASDNGVPSQSATVTVRVFLLDVNDSPPRFDRPFYQASVLEGGSPIKAITSVSATDDDLAENGTVSYYLLQSGLPFAIDSVTGEIVTSTVLDRETVAEYVLTVTAVDNCTEESLRLSSSVNVTVTVLDRNDNSPYFDVSHFAVQILDNTTVGSLVFSLSAFDDDAGSNGEVTWDVLSVNDRQTDFSIDETSGRVRVAEPVRFNQQSEYNYSLRVWDKGNPRRFNDVMLFIVIHDVNTRSPRFNPSVYSAVLFENATMDTTVLFVSATDGDPGPIGEVRYRILTEFDQAGSFSVDSSGTVRVDSLLDYDARSQIQFQIEAYDGGFPYPKTDLANVTVDLLDVNDNCPGFVFDTLSQFLQLRENTSPPQIVANVSSIVFDPDTGLGGVFNFSISAGDFVVLPPPEDEEDTVVMTEWVFSPALCNGTNDTEVVTFDNGTVICNGSYANTTSFSVERGSNIRTHFRLDSETGILTSGRIFDRESEPFAVIEFAFQDYGTPPLYCRSNVTVAITDDNDNNPYFVSNVNGTIIELNQIGEEIVSITAVDDDIDENARITYAIVGGNQGNSFAIHPDNGSVYAAIPLNKTVQRYFTLSIIAIDNGNPQRPSNQYGYVGIEVLDFNGEPPTFDSNILMATLPENEVMQFYTVVAQDLDEGSNADIEYILVNGESFAVSSTNGTLENLEPFNAENVSAIFLEVVAVDMGLVPLSTMVTVLVTIGDQNDNSPYFLNHTYHSVVVENSDVGLFVLNVEAFDDDRDSPNNDITYSLDNLYGKLFQVDPSSGDISVAMVIDYEANETFLFRVFATDGGDPPRVEFATVTVQVADVNDNAPAFEPASLKLGVLEGSSPDSFVGQLSTTDRDRPGNNTAVTFAIIADFSDGKFVLVGNSGNISTTVQFNREEREQYEFVVVATDGGVPPLSSTATIVVLILDSNDHVPFFNQSEFSSVIPEDTQSGVSFLQVFADDLDIEENGNLDFTISGSDSSPFQIDQKLGEISLGNESLDFEMRSSPYVFAVVATDNGSPKQSTTASVTISVTDVNDNEPVFLEPQYCGHIQENFAIGTKLTQVAASDEDSQSNSEIRFSLENGFGNFDIHPISGVIYTVGHLDYEVEPQVMLVAVASNPFASAPRSSSVNVTVTVDDVNDNYPTFEERFYHFSVPENSMSGHAFAQVSASDGDSGENGSVTYRITAGNVLDRFAIDPTSGSLSLRFVPDYEAPPVVYALTVEATDGSPQQFSNVTTVVVAISDQNDIPPSFPLSSSTSIVNSGARPGSEVVTLVAIDNDTPTTSPLSYQIVGGNEGGLFSIPDPLVGRIVTVADLSGVAGGVFVLAVQVNDSLSVSEHSATVEVEGPAANLPVFELGSYAASLAEGSVPTSAIFSVFAIVDPDYRFFQDDNGIHGDGYTAANLFSNYGIFSIDGNGGVRLTAPADYESQSVYQLTIAANNSNGFAFVMATVRITDINDESPFSPTCCYTVAIPETTARNSVILNLPAQDRDGTAINRQLSFSLVSSDAGAGVFGVGGASGDVVLMGELDYDNNGAKNFSLVVEVSDGVATSAALVNVLVTEANDNPPRTLNNVLQYTFSFNESTPAGTVLDVDLSASDSDSGLNSELSFGLTGNLMYTDFEIDNRTGSIRLIADLDRERESKYTLTAHVSDMGNPPNEALVAIVVNVLDLNDNNPVWESEQYFATIIENMATGSEIARVSASDMDEIFFTTNSSVVEYHITNGLVRYSITDGDPHQLFSIDNATGVVTVAAPPDRELSPTFNLTLTASDGGGRHANATLYVTIIDLNDSPPVFTQSTYLWFLQENYIPDSPFGRVLAYDDDTGPGSKFNYSIETGNLDNTFAINNETGELLLLQSLNRESTELFNFTVVAVDMGIPMLSGSAQVVVNVQDENDHAPTFTSPSYSLLVEESTAPSTIVDQIIAEDDDFELNAVVVYRLFVVRNQSRLLNESFSNETIFFQEFSQSDTFSINSSSGEISVIGELDFESVFQYDLVVTATDSAPPGQQLNSSAELTIFIGDVNDNPPLFTRDRFEASVVENSPSGFPVLTVNATDRDMDDPLSFSILVPNSNPFNISETGTVLVNGMLDTEVAHLYEFTVVVSDSASPPHISQSNVSITVLDRNEHPPTFAQPFYMAAILENQPIGLHLSQDLSTTDADFNHASVEFELETVIIANETVCLSKCGNRSFCSRLPKIVILSSEEESVFVMNAFLVDSQSGVILTNASFDRELIGFYVLVVTATDDPVLTDDTRLSSSVCVAVVIDDVNDNDPIFTESGYSITIEENSESQLLLVFSVSDSDLPPNSETLFSVLNYSAGGEAFTLHPQGTLNLTGPLDHEENPAIIITVVAENINNLQRFSVATVIVVVSDVNDNRPDFEQPVYYVSISEATSPNTIITTVRAGDRDSGVNAQLRYYAFEENVTLSSFQIHSSNGSVGVVGNLDFESQESHTLVITAIDGGIRPLNSTAVLIVTLLDENDNAPMFVDLPYEGTVSEAASFQTTIFTVSAVDSDHGNNSYIEYAITATLPGGNMFAINEATGAIFLLESLDAEQVGQFSIVVVASNGPGSLPLLSTTATVTLVVTDVNDNAPMFEAEAYTVAVSEAAENGSAVFQLTATDRDVSELNSQFRFSILPDSIEPGHLPLLVQIDPSNGSIFVQGMFDFESNMQYHFIVVAMDTGVPSLNSTTQVTIVIQDENDNFPVFAQSSYSFEILENRPGNEFVGVVMATDADTSNLSYHIEDGEDGIHFEINSTSGIITTIASLDRDMQSLYQINVSVVDMGTNDVIKMATVPVSVELLDENDNAPVFFEDVFAASISENVSVATSILNLTAFDLDSGTNSVITYSLVSSEDSSHFQVNSETSELVTAMSFDRETQSSFSFSVQGVDGGNPPMTSSAEVLIVIIDINDNRPLFEKELYSNIINENIGDNTLVVELAAFDIDAEENSQFTFSLSGNHFDAFVVNSDSGVISTNALIDFEQRPFYNFTAVVTDLGNPPLMSTVAVAIEIVDLNDNPPVLDSAVYSVTVAENSILDDLVFQIPATDADSTSNSDLLYTITNGLTNSFTLNEEDGIITVAEYLDREMVDFYTISLRVVDKGTSPFTASALLNIQVTDQNDNPPLFPRQQFEFEIDELRVDESVVVGVVNASDADIPPNSDLTYSIIGDGFGGRFSISSLDGTITASGLIRFSEEKSFTLIVEVKDGGIPSPLRDTAAVRVAIRDVNSLAPSTVLSRYEVTYRISETLAFLSASDADRNPSTRTTYRIPDGLSALSFSVDNTGTLTSTRPAVLHQTDTVTVSVSDGLLSSEVSFTLSGNPGDTTNPVFSPVAMAISVSEGTSMNTVIGSVEILSTGNDVVISIPSPTATTSSVYSHSSQRDGLLSLLEAFDVTADGSIVLKDPSFLDRELRDFIIIPLEAVDQATMATAYGTVTIEIVDANDNPPVFDAQMYSVGVSELITLDSSLLSVFAFDLDEQGPNKDVSYSIVSGNDDGHFSITSEGGITLETALDRESQPSHSLVVRATNDQSLEILSSDVAVVVEVFDTNDNTPEFSKPVFNVELLDNVTIGTEVFQPRASDPDEGSNSHLVYSLTYESHPGVFTVNQSTGAFTTARPLLPGVTQPTYSVTLHVADRGAPVPLSSQSAILFEVYPVNNYPPVFQKELYSVEIDEIASTESEVITVSASDNDTAIGATLVYEIVSGNEDSDFTIHSDSGTVTVNHELDFQRTSEYSLVVVANDNGRPVALTTTTTVSVIIADVNNHSPEFDQSTYESILMENVTVGTTVAVVKATDPDAETITYLISVNSIGGPSDEELFTINSTSGEISTLAPLDFEESHDHQLTITATDSGYPTNRLNTVRVNVTVMDLNDTPPLFTTTSYTATVYRLQRVGTFVTMVTAVDPDSIGQSTVYMISSGNDDGLFEINSTTGVLIAARDIPESSSCDVCALVVTATDGIQSTSVVVMVTLSSDGMYCDAGGFCTTIANRTRSRCPVNLEPSPGQHLCLAYSCLSTETYPCVPAYACVANGYACLGACPEGESVCPTTDACHSVSMETTCDGSDNTCLLGQVLIQNENGVRSCKNPESLSSSVARSCTASGASVYCSELDQCSPLLGPDLCLRCPAGRVHCPPDDRCYNHSRYCCSAGEDFCALLDHCIPPTHLCQLPNAPPAVPQDLFLAEVMTSFDGDDIYGGNGSVVGFLISSTNGVARDSQGEELGVAVVGVSSISESQGAWQFARCSDGVSESFGSCGVLQSDWTTISSVSESHALVLPPNFRIRFVRKTLNQEAAVWMRVKLWDGNQDGYLSPALNLTRDENPHFASTVPFTATSAYSQRSTLIASLLYPATTLPEFTTEGETLSLPPINEEERPLHNLGSRLEGLSGEVTVHQLPVLDGDVIGGFPPVPDSAIFSHYQDLVPSDVRTDYFDAVAMANPAREQRQSASVIGRKPGVAVSFDLPTNFEKGTWQVSTSGSVLLWRPLSSMISEDGLLLLNLDARIRFLPAKDFYGNVFIRLQPWDGHVPDSAMTSDDITYHVIQSSSNQVLSQPNLNSAVLGLVVVNSVEEGPVVFIEAFELDPLPYQIGYEYERLFSFRIESPQSELVALEANQMGVSQPLSFTIGQSVTIKRLLPATSTSTYVTFSVHDDHTTLEQLEGALRQATLLQNTIGAFSKFSKDTFYGPGDCCYGNRPDWGHLHGTQVQQVAKLVAIDDDSVVIGLAVVGISNHEDQMGVWQYYRSNYSNPDVVLSPPMSTYHPRENPWINFPGNLSETSSFLLRPQDRVRFVPHPMYVWNRNQSQPFLMAKPWDLYLWQQDGEIPELNYHNIDTDPFTADRRSLILSIGQFSDETVKLSISRHGCDGVAGSGLVHDACCVCGGGGPPCNVATETTSPVYNNCSAHDGDTMAAMGCDFIPFSNSELGSCSECLTEVSIPTSILSSRPYWNQSAIRDCSNSCHGAALIDGCGICSGSHNNHVFNSDMDCSGMCFGKASVDFCGACSEGSTGRLANGSLDCTGVCNGPFVDVCDVCQNPSSPSYARLRDCNGDCSGGAQLDRCGVCFGGNSIVLAPNSTVDACGVCGGAGGGCDGCDGVTASGRAVDGCGECGGNGCGCVRLISATPTRGPSSRGSEITIKGAGFFRNSSDFNFLLPNCGVSKLESDNITPVPVRCTFTTPVTSSQLVAVGTIVDQSTITCTLSGTNLAPLYEISVAIDNGPLLSRQPPVLFETDDYSQISTSNLLPSDSPAGTSPVVIFTGENFINTSYEGCLIAGFSSCTEDSNDVSFVQGTFLSPNEISCRLPMATLNCQVMVTLTLNGKVSGRVQSPGYQFTFGTSPPAVTSVHFSPDLLNLLIDFDRPITLQMVDLQPLDSFDCSSIFNSETLVAIGYPSAVCSFATNEATQIIIRLPSVATVTHGTNIMFLDDVISAKTFSLTIPIRNLTVPVNGSVNALQPIAVLEGNPAIPPCPAHFSFHGYNSRHPGYKPLTYLWSVHVVDSSIQSYTDIVNYLDTLQPQSSSIALNSQWFVPGHDYTLQLTVRNSQGLTSSPVFVPLSHTDQSDFSRKLFVDIEGPAERTVYSNHELFLKSIISIPICNVTEFQNEYRYSWSIFEVLDVQRGTLRELATDVTMTTTIPTLSTPGNTLNSSSVYFFRVLVTIGDQVGSGNVTVSVEPWESEARLFGGSVTCVSHDDDIILDTSLATINPDLGTPSYIWSCIQLASQQPCYNMSDPEGGVVRLDFGENIVTLPARYLATDTVYNFSLSIAQSDARSTANILVLVQPGNTETDIFVGISPVDVVTATDRLVLRGWVYSNADDIQAAWTSVNEPGYSALDLQASSTAETPLVHANSMTAAVNSTNSIAPHLVNPTSLVLAPGSLLPGQRYAIQLTATSGGGTHSCFARIDLEVGPAPMSDFSLDPPTGLSLSTNFVITPTAVNAHPSQLPLTFRFGIQNQISNRDPTFWMSGFQQSPSFQTILPSVSMTTNTSIIIRVQAKDMDGNFKDSTFSVEVQHNDVSMATVVERIQSQFTNSKNWVETLSAIGAVLHQHSVSGMTLDNGTVGVFTEILLNVSSYIPSSSSSHSLLIVQYLNIIASQSPQIAQSSSESISTLILDAVDNHMFQFQNPHLDWSAQHNGLTSALNLGVNSGSQSAPSNQDLTDNLKTMEFLMSRHPDSSRLRRDYQQLINSISIGLCSASVVGESQRSLATENSRLAVQKFSIPSLRGVYRHNSCSDSQFCPTFDLGNSFSSAIQESACRIPEGTTLQLCQEVCLQSSVEVIADTFVLSNTSKNLISSEIFMSDPEMVSPISASSSSLSVQFLSAIENGYVNLSNLTSPITVEIPLSGEVPAMNESLLLCLYRQRDSDGIYDNQEWSLDNLNPPNVVAKNGLNLVQCSVNHLTQFMVAMLPLPVIEPTTSISMISSSSSMTTSSSTPVSSSVIPPTAPIADTSTPIAVSVVIVLFLLILVVAVVVILIILCWWYKKRQSKVDIGAADTQHILAETESLKVADLRVPKDVIVLLPEGKRDLLGKVLVVPSIKLKELRDVLVGTFEEKLEKKPFYLVTTELLDIEPALEPFQYINIVYKTAVFIRVEREPTETSLRHFCICGKVAQYECSQCVSRGYCSPHCQLSDWNGDHGKECKRLAEKKRRRDILERRGSVQSGLASPTATHAGTPSDRSKSVQDWRALIASRKSSRGQLRPLAMLSPISEQTSDSLATARSQGKAPAEGIDSAGKEEARWDQGLNLSMKRAPQPSDPFSASGEGQALARTLPQIRSQLKSPPTDPIGQPVPDRPMDPHDNNSYYWNRFPAAVRKGQPQQPLPPVTRPPPARPAFGATVPPIPRSPSDNFVPPQPLDPANEFDMERSIDIKTRPPVTTPLFSAPRSGPAMPHKMTAPRLTLASINSLDFASNSVGSGRYQQTRGEPVLDELESDTDSEGSSTSITSSSSVSSSSEGEGEESNSETPSEGENSPSPAP